MENIKFEVIKKISETKFNFKNLKNIEKLESNSPPSIFIGSKLRYPLVNVGILSPLEKNENSWIYDNPKYWSNNDFQIGEVVKLRTGLLNSRFQSKVQDVRLNKKFIEITKEIGMASKQVDIEIEFKNKLNIEHKKDRIITPHGMNANLKKARITGNVKIPQKIDKVFNDDLKAVDSMKYLYENEFNEYTLSKILSIGVLGFKKNRKLVPTRWSITTTDDILGKQLIEKIKDYKLIENYELFIGGFMGNYYLIFLLPKVWSYELFELYFPGSSWNSTDTIKASTDYENYYGRKNYASNTSGGYYAARLPLLEYLEKQKKQASILAIRLETPSYWASLGVWVVRESIRKTLSSKKMSFDDKTELLNSGKQISKIKFDFDITPILNESKLLRDIQSQKRLQEFFK